MISSCKATYFHTSQAYMEDMASEAVCVTRRLRLFRCGCNFAVVQPFDPTPLLKVDSSRAEPLPRGSRKNRRSSPSTT